MKNPLKFEPAVIGAAITAIATAVLPFLTVPDTTKAAIGAAVAAVVGLLVRAGVTPTAKTPVA